MKDWEQKLDEFLRFNERRVLPHAGNMSKKEADDHARLEYDQFAERRREHKESLGEADNIKALEEAARLAPAGTRVRSQSYRSAFLQAYTGRIGQRLEEINAAVFAEADPDEAEAFLPVLRSRADQVDDLVDERFGALTTSRVRGGFDAAGWASGTVAGDNARLDSGQLDDPVPSGS